MRCPGDLRLAWFRDGTIHVWCTECDAEVVRPVALPANIEWIDTEEPDGEGARYPMAHAELRAAVERAATARFPASHEPVDRPPPRIHWPRAA